MSVPPPPNQWGSQPPTGGQPAGAPQWGPPPGGQQGGAPQWGPQQPWGPPPGPPPRRGGKGKWILAGIAVLAVIAVTVVITVLVVGKDSGGGESPTPTNGNGSDFASANDKGPVGDHHRGSDLCRVESRRSIHSWTRRTKSDGEHGIRRFRRRAWTPDQRSMYDSVGKAMRSAADQTVPLVKLTPHRVIRELYEQFIAYSRALRGAHSTYTPHDNDLAVGAGHVQERPRGIFVQQLRYGSASAQGAVGTEGRGPVKDRTCRRSCRSATIPYINAIRSAPNGPRHSAQFDAIPRPGEAVDPESGPPVDARAKGTQ